MRYYGWDAIRKIEQIENRTLCEEERRVVMCEAYDTEEYLDSKGIPTKGVGQTGEWLNKTFAEAFQHHVERVTRRIPDYPKLPTYLRAELCQAEYRGDLGHSPAAVKLINTRQWAAAAEEFLDNDEYRNMATPRQIKRRMKAVWHALCLKDIQED